MKKEWYTVECLQCGCRKPYRKAYHPDTIEPCTDGGNPDKMNCKIKWAWGEE